MANHRFLCVIFSGIAVFLRVKAFIQVSSSLIYPTDNTMGQTAIFRCSWNQMDAPGTLYFKRVDGAVYFSCDLLTRSCTRGTASRNRHNTSSSGSPSISMTIQDLQCLDEGVYRCQIIILSAPDITHFNTSSFLRIKVRPTSPKLSNVQMSVQEDQEITASCKAILGYPRPLQIVWKTYRNGNVVNLTTELVTTVNPNRNLLPHLELGGYSCAHWTKSTVRLKALRSYQDLILACFVTNLDFQPTAPDFCEEPTKDLCNQTDPVSVLYPVPFVKLTTYQSGPYVEGDTVTLRCYSDGNPSPTFNWTKDGDETRTLTSVLDGLSSVLTITAVDACRASGVYRCTASNVINGVTHYRTAVMYLFFNPVSHLATTEVTMTKFNSVTSAHLQHMNCSNILLIITAVNLSIVTALQLIFIIYLMKRNKDNILSRRKQMVFKYLILITLVILLLILINYQSANSY